MNLFAYVLIATLVTSLPVSAQSGVPLNSLDQGDHGPLVAPLSSPEIIELNDEQAKSVAYAEMTGLDIYRHDQAAWGATDFFRQRGVDEDERLRGWITEDEGDSIRVMWIGEIAGEYRLFREVRVQGQAVVDGSFQIYEAGKPLDQRQVAAFTARKTALGSSFKGCQGTYNTVVLPTPQGAPAGYDVFMLVALQDWSRIMVGGNVRVRVDYTGTKVLETKSFTNSCLVVGGERVPETADVVSVTLSDVLGQSPTPIHVFLNLQHKLPFVVLTTQNGIVWQIEDGRIAAFDRVSQAD